MKFSDRSQVTQILVILDSLLRTKNIDQFCQKAAEVVGVQFLDLVEIASISDVHTITIFL